MKQKNQRRNQKQNASTTCTTCHKSKPSNRYKLCKRCRKIGRHHRDLYISRYPDRIKAYNHKRAKYHSEYNKRWRAKRKIHVRNYFKKHNQKYRERNSESIYYGKIKYKYGLSKAKYEKLLTKQRGVCAICLRPPSERKYGRLHVDHDHKTNKIRGLLCYNCNHGLGLFKDNRQNLYRAANYLKGSKPFEKEPEKDKDAKDK
jgi:Recombination endonuclease VII